MQELRDQLSAIEPDESIYGGIGPAEIPLLEQLLADKQAWLASRAVFALSRIPDARAVAVLARAAADPRQEVRVAAAAAVSKFKPADANAILLKLLADPELGVRKFALQAVPGTHDPAVHAKLRDLVAADPAPWIRDAARSRLRELNLQTR
jgi:HEAT repeat protein